MINWKNYEHNRCVTKARLDHDVSKRTNSAYVVVLNAALLVSKVLYAAQLVSRSQPVTEKQTTRQQCMQFNDLAKMFVLFSQYDVIISQLRAILSFLLLRLCHRRFHPINSNQWSIKSRSNRGSNSSGQIQL